MLIGPENLRVGLRAVARTDEKEFTRLMRASQDLHEPWISPPTNATTFRYYLQRIARTDHEGYAICLRDNGAIVGAININNIVRGSFLSASLGYYIGAPYAGQGYMTEALKILIDHACGTLGLHRLEANIQPENEASQRLVASCGFINEGLSRKFLFIDGAWRDHVRWCYLDRRESLQTYPQVSVLESG